MKNDYTRRRRLIRLALTTALRGFALAWVDQILRPAVTRHHAPACRRILPTSDRCALACPILESRTARACREAGSLETAIRLGFRQVDRLPTPGYSAVSSARRFAGRTPVPVGCAAPEGSLDLSQTSIFRPHVPAAAAAMSRGIRDACSTQLQRWEDIRYGLAMITRPAGRR